MAAPLALVRDESKRMICVGADPVIVAGIVFAILLCVYALVMWLTRQGGPADIMKFWDEGQ